LFRDAVGVQEMSYLYAPSVHPTMPNDTSPYCPMCAKGIPRRSAISFLLSDCIFRRSMVDCRKEPSAFYIQVHKNNQRNKGCSRNFMCPWRRNAEICRFKKWISRWSLGRANSKLCFDSSRLLLNCHYYYPADSCVIMHFATSRVYKDVIVSTSTISIIVNLSLSLLVSINDNIRYL